MIILSGWSSSDASDHLQIFFNNGEIRLYMARTRLDKGFRGTRPPGVPRPPEVLGKCVTYVCCQLMPNLILLDLPENLWDMGQLYPSSETAKVWIQYCIWVIIYPCFYSQDVNHYLPGILTGRKEQYPSQVVSPQCHPPVGWGEGFFILRYFICSTMFYVNLGPSATYLQSLPTTSVHRASKWDQ